MLEDAAWVGSIATVAQVSTLPEDVTLRHVLFTGRVVSLSDSEVF